MVTKTSPIGIIDSGIGGFSVALKMQQMLPHENLLYFGDGGNMPYGNHTAEEILTMTRYMLRFMEERGVKALLVACNTISCLIEQYRDDMSCPVLSVVQAGADAVAQMPVHKVGVISTCFTHSTRCYPDLIGKEAPDKVVVSHGCPDLFSYHSIFSLEWIPHFSFLFFFFMPDRSAGKSHADGNNTCHTAFCSLKWI